MMTEKIEAETEGEQLIADVYSEEENLQTSAMMHKENADASASNILGGIWGHESFINAIADFIGKETAMYTHFYDFGKRVGGDGMAYSPINKMNCNTKNEDIVVGKVLLKTPENVGRFAALVDELGWAMEWGFEYDSDNRVVFSPSNKLDY